MMVIDPDMDDELKIIWLRQRLRGIAYFASKASEGGGGRPVTEEDGFNLIFDELFDCVEVLNSLEMLKRDSKE